MKSLHACSSSRAQKAKFELHPSDRTLEASPDELQAIRSQLHVIEEMLARIGGAEVYSREPEGIKARAKAADIVCTDFDEIREKWADSVAEIMVEGPVAPDAAERLRENLSNALLRFIDHLRDPEDITTYVYLRRHCQAGMLARAKTSQFNTIHIALKQILLSHVKASMNGRAMERIRDVMVAAIDERRLMVSQFYIESREKALRDSEQKYRNTIDHAPDPMFEIEPGTWIVTGANAAAEKLRHIEPGVNHVAMTGHPITEFVPPELRDGVVHGLEQVMREGAAQSPEFPVGPYFFDVNMALIGAGERKFIQMILRDVTQRREMLDTLLKSERLAAAGTFAAGVAHEVNNPLASISSLVQSLLTGEADPQRRSTMHTILSQITRISSTLKDLVNFARPATLQRKPVDLNAIVTETTRLINYNKRFAGVKLDLELAPDLTPAFADDNEIQQVLLNLLFNAADASKAQDAQIRVVSQNCRGGDKRPRVMIKVIDNGIGIPPENLERVFDPFFTTKPAGAGAGLGLSLCQRIILANHGTIKVESRVGNGTAVTITLPVADEYNVAQSQSPSR
jgi:PAS domain S-box-containing protein